MTQVTPSSSDGNVQTEATVWVVRLGKPRRAPDVLPDATSSGSGLTDVVCAAATAPSPFDQFIVWSCLHILKITDFTNEDADVAAEKLCGSALQLSHKAVPAGSRHAVSVSAFFEGI